VQTFTRRAVSANRIDGTLEILLVEDNPPMQVTREVSRGQASTHLNVVGDGAGAAFLRREGIYESAPREARCCSTSTSAQDGRGVLGGSRPTRCSAGSR
jgi:hypothetical protein